MRRMRTRGGFTLVELMIVVALIGVLAAIAIPGFLSYQARARRAESYSNLSALAIAEKGYVATGGSFHDSVLPWPDASSYGGLGTSKMQWDASAEAAFAERRTAWGVLVDDVGVGSRNVIGVAVADDGDLVCRKRLCFRRSDAQ